MLYNLRISSITHGVQNQTQTLELAWPQRIFLSTQGNWSNTKKITYFAQVLR